MTASELTVGLTMNFAYNYYLFSCSNSLYLLVFVSQRLIFAEESGGTLSYLDETLKKALLHIMRLFDKLIVSGIVLCVLYIIVLFFEGRKKETDLRCKISSGK